MEQLDPTIPCKTCGAVPIHWILARIDAVEVYGLCNSCVARLLVATDPHGD